MNKKQVFYDRHGVEEYYLYDPDRNDFSGWMRSQGRLDVIDAIENWVSPRLGIRFDLSGEVLQIYRPDKRISKVVQAPGFIRGINPKSKIENPQAPAFIRGSNLKSKI